MSNGDGRVRAQIEQGFNAAVIVGAWDETRAAYSKQIKDCMMYD